MALEAGFVHLLMSIIYKECRFILQQNLGTGLVFFLILNATRLFTECYILKFAYLALLGILIAIQTVKKHYVSFTVRGNICNKKSNDPHQKVLNLYQEMEILVYDKIL